MSKNWKKITAVLQVPGIESKDGGVFLQEEQMDALESELGKPDANAAELTQAKTDVQNANTAKNKAEGELATANQKITELNAEITALKAKPADTPTTVKTDGPKTKEKSGNSAFTPEQQRYAQIQNFSFTTSNLEESEEDEE